MRNRKGWWLLSLAAIALVALLVSPRATLAGGWSVVTLDTSPADVRAGSIVEVGFMVRQHGVRPALGLTPAITLRNVAIGELVTATARPKGANGHYVANFTLPSAGTWEWEIEAWGPPAQMAPIQVAAATAQAPASEARGAPVVEPASMARPSPQVWAWAAAGMIALVVMAMLGVPRIRRKRLSAQS